MAVSLERHGQRERNSSRTAVFLDDVSSSTKFCNVVILCGVSVVWMVWVVSGSVVVVAVVVVVVAVVAVVVLAVVVALVAMVVVVVESGRI